MNPQEIFNKVSLHLLTQDSVCLSYTGYCVYKGENNTACAVGCLIPEERYSKNMEKRNIEVLFKDFPTLANFIGIHNQPLLEELQNIHDNRRTDYSVTWKEQLIKLGNRYSFTLPPCLQDTPTICTIKQTIEQPIALQVTKTINQHENSNTQNTYA